MTFIWPPTQNSSQFAYSMQDDTNPEVESDSDEEGSRNPVTEKKKIDKGDDFDDVEGVLLIANAIARCWRPLALRSFRGQFVADGGLFSIGRCFDIAYIRLIDCACGRHYTYVLK
uniref:Uncharacterized protein n=1 Tax=Hyaloperonospora arabidopsidis (strain Emoy2) TaxID=559515 RepID=M4C1G0_HYAAE